MKKTLAQKANHNFDNGHYVIFEPFFYYEFPNGEWEKVSEDKDGNNYYENSNGFKAEVVYDNDTRWFLKSEMDAFDLLSEEEKCAENEDGCCINYPQCCLNMDS